MLLNVIEGAGFLLLVLAFAALVLGVTVTRR